ncbi:MAG: hypothetical protein HY902_01585 [Deltaproteobacteria bacterium]|nr:hypothetical protein [Deltaproteobacteria bacterium]
MPSLAAPTLTVARTCALVVFTLACAGCGASVQFDRAAGVPKYKALPAKTAVQVVESADLLPQPVVVVGSLRMTSPKGEADRAEVTAGMQKEAFRFGCDAVVGLQVVDQVDRSMRWVDKPGPSGKPVRQQEPVEKHTWNWSAQCVRSAQQPATLPTTPAKTPAK